VQGGFQCGDLGDKSIFEFADGSSIVEFNFEGRASRSGAEGGEEEDVYFVHGIISLQIKGLF